MVKFHGQQERLAGWHGMIAAPIPGAAKRFGDLYERDLEPLLEDREIEGRQC